MADAEQLAKATNRELLAEAVAYLKVTDSMVVHGRARELNALIAEIDGRLACTEEEGWIADRFGITVETQREWRDQGSEAFRMLTALSRLKAANHEA